MDQSVMRENARLRKDIAGYQSAMEEMEVRAKAAEQTAKELSRKLARIRQVLSEVTASGTT